MRFPAPLPRTFYSRDTHEVAKDLLGKLLVRRNGTEFFMGRICEVESYVGENDKACHASKGKTKRTEVMYGRAGHAYIYLIYGMYHCFNVVTEVENFPAAVLIRACENNKNIFSETNGPGKVCREFGIDRSLNTVNLTTSKELYIANDGTHIPDKRIISAPRVGVAYAGDDALLPWRYFYSK